MDLKRGKFDNCQAGIAIAPILFVVAILAVLVGALAASSGGFSQSTSRDSNRIKASTVIEGGANLKAGFERLYGGAVDIEQIILSQQYSAANATLALYAPDGGGLGPQAPAPGATPASGITNWRFVQNANLLNIGLNGANDFAVVIGVANDEICRAVNEIIFGKDAAQAQTIPSASASGITLNDADSCTDTTVATTSAGCNVAANVFDLSAVTALSGRSQACVTDGNGNDYYYQLLLAK